MTPCLALTCGLAPSRARTDEPPPLEAPATQPAALSGRGNATPTGARAMHEATTALAQARQPDRLASSPPAPIPERPGDSPPSENAQWVEGYWDWDPARRDFVWVTGGWRNPPPGRFWVNGYWRRDDRGWYRVPGFWCARKGTPGAASPASIVSTSASGAASDAAGPIEGEGVDPTKMTSPGGTTTRVVARPTFAGLDREASASLPSALSDPAAAVSTAPDPSPATVAVPQEGAPAPSADANAPASTTAPSLAALADQLAGEAAAFEQVFGRTAAITPFGGNFLADARRLQGGALALRQAVDAGDVPSATLAYRDINATWWRMANLVNRIAPGRTGPNIQQIWRMGGTIAQIAQLVP